MNIYLLVSSFDLQKWQFNVDQTYTILKGYCNEDSPAISPWFLLTTQLKVQVDYKTAQRLICLHRSFICAKSNTTLQLSKAVIIFIKGILRTTSPGVYRKRDWEERRK